VVGIISQRDLGRAGSRVEERRRHTCGCSVLRSTTTFARTSPANSGASCGKFWSSIERITVRLSDANGPKALYARRSQIPDDQSCGPDGRDVSETHAELPSDRHSFWCPCLTRQTRGDVAAAAPHVQSPCPCAVR
jgi:hypothetical protein